MIVVLGATNGSSGKRSFLEPGQNKKQASFSPGILPHKITVMGYAIGFFKQGCRGASVTCCFWWMVDYSDFTPTTKHWQTHPPVLHIKAKFNSMENACSTLITGGFPLHLVLLGSGTERQKFSSSFSVCGVAHYGISSLFYSVEPSACTFKGIYDNRISVYLHHVGNEFVYYW